MSDDFGFLDGDPIRWIICGKCKESKDLRHYHNNWTSKNGFSNWCKECTRVYQRERYQKKRQAYLDRKERQAQLDAAITRLTVEE